MDLPKEILSLNQIIPSKKQTTELLRRLPQYVIYACLGVIGGAVGVIIAFLLAIIVQSFLPSQQSFMLGIVPTTVLAVVFGLGISWLLTWSAEQIVFLKSMRNLRSDGIQVIFICSVLTSLLETFLFMQNMYSEFAQHLAYISV